MNSNQEKEYEMDYKHAMEHPHKGVKCTNCIATYFHPLLGCPKCGKYKDIYTPTNNEERCVGNCPNTCKVHMGEYQFCTNEGCKCHLSQTTTKDWEESIREEFKIFWLTYNEDERYGRIFADWWIAKLESTKQEERKKVVKRMWKCGMFGAELIDFAKLIGIDLSE